MTAERAPGAPSAAPALGEHTAGCSPPSLERARRPLTAPRSPPARPPRATARRARAAPRPARRRDRPRARPLVRGAVRAGAARRSRRARHQDRAARRRADAPRACPFPDAGAIKVLQGKESVALDLDAPEGREIVHRLARRADLVLMSYRAGVAERLGVDYAIARAREPAARLPGGAGLRRRRAVRAQAGVRADDRRRERRRRSSRRARRSRTGPELTLDEIKPASIRLNWAAQAPGNADGCSALGVATALLLGLVARERTGRRPGDADLDALHDRLRGLRRLRSTTPVAPPRRTPDPELLRPLRALSPVRDRRRLGLPRRAAAARVGAALRARWSRRIDLAGDARFATPEDRARRNDAALAGGARRRLPHARGARLGARARRGRRRRASRSPTARSPRAVMRRSDRARGRLPRRGRASDASAAHRRLAPLVALSLTPGRGAPGAGPRPAHRARCCASSATRRTRSRHCSLRRSSPDERRRPLGGPAASGWVHPVSRSRVGEPRSQRAAAAE